MPWFRVDDNLAFHQKTLRAGNAAMGMWVRAGSWCAQQLEDGFVPDEIVATMGGAAVAKKLVTAELWLRVDGGYRFHQWVERQPTRSQVEQERKAAQLRKERWRERRRNTALDADGTDEERRSERRDERQDTTVENTAPTRAATRPDPTQPQVEKPSVSQPHKRGTRIDPDWKPPPTEVQWRRENGISDDTARRELPKFVDYWTAKSGRDAAKLDWLATWRNWLRTAQEREPRPPGSRPPAPNPQAEMYRSLSGGPR